jgi:hypothetical protein
MMAARPRRAKPGDVLELATYDGFIYLQYLGKHPEYGDAVMVSPAKQDHRVHDLDQLFKAGYVDAPGENCSARRGQPNMTLRFTIHNENKITLL